MKKKNNKWILIFVAVVAVMLVAIVIMILANENKKTTVVRQTEAIENTQEQGTTDYKTIIYNGETYQYNSDIKTILFLGIDKNMEDASYVGTGGRSDSMILFLINEKERTAQMLTIPRESMVDVETYGPNGDYLGMVNEQITLQYSFGDGGKRSCWLSKKTVSKLLDDIPIDAYVAMNLEGIGMMTTLIGGVDITIPEDYTQIDESFQQGASLNLKGDLAEKYVRTRDIQVFASNEGRMKRQDQFIRALVEQLKPKLQADSSLLQSLLDHSSSYLVTDMNVDEIKSLLSCSLAQDTKILPGERTQPVEDEPEEFHVDEDALTQLLVELLYIKQ